MSVYYCPTSGDYECDQCGGFAVCCNRPDLHRGAEGYRITVPLALLNVPKRIENPTEIDEEEEAPQ